MGIDHDVKPFSKSYFNQRKVKVNNSSNPGVQFSLTVSDLQARNNNLYQVRKSVKPQFPVLSRPSYPQNFAKRQAPTFPPMRYPQQVYPGYHSNYPNYYNQFHPTY
jgi:hypothetical protein